MESIIQNYTQMAGQKGPEMLIIYCLVSAAVGIFFTGWEEASRTGSRRVTRLLSAACLLSIGWLTFALTVAVLNEKSEWYSILLLIFFSLVFFFMGCAVGRWMARLVIGIAILFRRKNPVQAPVYEPDPMSTPVDYGPWMRTPQ